MRRRTWWIASLAAGGTVAIAIYAIPRSHDVAAPPGTVMQLPASYYVGLDAAETGDWLTAVAAFEQAIQEDPNAPPLLLALGTAEIEAGRPLLGAVHLSAYLEAFPNAPNATKVARRIQAIATIHKAMARDMAAEAVAQLEAIPDARTRGQRSGALVGRLLDMANPPELQSFAAIDASGMTGATLRHVLARGIAAKAPDKAYQLLRNSIDAEAAAAALDVDRVGCSPQPIAGRVCSVTASSYGEVSAGYCDFKEPTARPGSRAAFAGYLEYHVAAHLWESGAPEPLLRRLLEAHRSNMSLVDPTQTNFGAGGCFGWPLGMPEDSIRILELAEGGPDAWGSEGHVDFSRPSGKRPVVLPAPPEFRNWRKVVASKRVELGPDRIELAFDDVVFGNVAEVARAIGREPADQRAEHLVELALKLSFLAERLG